MREIQLVPGAVATPNPITIPVGCPDIDAVVSAEIWRLPVALGLNNHAQADIVAALANHTQVQIVASLANHTELEVVAAIADHAAHGHDLTTVVPAGAGTALTDPLAPGPIEGGVAGQVNLGAVDVLAAAQAHAVGAAAVAHGNGAAETAHVAGGAEVAHGGAADPVVAAVPAKLTQRTFSLSVNTLLGDIVTLIYSEQGARLRPA